MARIRSRPALLCLLTAIAVLAALFAAQPALAAPGDHVPAMDFDLDALNHNADGITSTGTHFYVPDRNSIRLKVYAYAIDGLYTPTLDFSLGAAVSGAQAITWTGDYFYVVDEFDEKAYAYASDGTYSAAASFDLDTENDDPRGITWTGSYFYVVDQFDEKAYAYASDGTYSAAASFDLDTENDDPKGITWSDAGYFYVVDRTDEKVYTYTVTGSYANVDIDLAAGNTSASGITLLGGHLYVVDISDNQVYAYEEPNADPMIIDTTLSSLSLNPGALSPSFSGTVTDYHTTVPNSATSVNVSATPSQSGATVTGTGTHALHVGVNPLEVVVTATNGVSIQTYSIEVTREGMPTAVAFDASGVLTTPMGTVVDSSISGADCFLFPSDQQVVVTVFNEEAMPLGVCWSTSLLYFLFPSGTPDFTSDIASAISFEADLREGSASSFKRNETSGSLLNASTSATATVSGTTYDYSQSDNLTLISGALSNLAVGDAAHLSIEITNDRTVDDFSSTDEAATPSAPDELLSSRSSDYEQATVSWKLVGQVIEYQVERQTALPVTAGDLARIEYGDVTRFLVPGVVWGVDSYTDTTVSANKTYQYRVRARRGGTMWSDWSDYVASGRKPEVDVDPPSNIRLSRMHDNSSITVSWTAPAGEFDNFTLQRQELVAADGSSIFANAVTLGGSNWIDGTITTYTDSSILPNRTYEYRLASVVDDAVGEYTDWVRSSPISTSLGASPGNLRYVDDSTSRMLDDRREFKMAWDEMDGVVQYEVEVLIYHVARGEQTMEHYIVTDPSFFRTSYGRSDIRVRGRKADDDLCGSGADDYCYSDWTGWYGVRFTPKVTIEAPMAVDDTADQDIVELRESTTEAIEASLSAAGAPVDASLVVQFLTVLAATVIGGISVALGWRLGMAPLGIGMGAAIAILILFTGYRLFGVPLAWPVAIQAALAVAGMFALVRQTGVFR